MKKAILLTLATTALFARPNYLNNNSYSSNIQWSRQANIYANQAPAQQHQRQQVNKLYDKPYKQTAHKPNKTIPPFSYTSKQNKIDVLIGKNLFLDNDDIDNSIAAGIRYSRLINENNYIQIGYEGIFGANYSSDEELSEYAKDKGNNISSDETSSVTTSGDINLNRLYVNAMHEFLNYKVLYPYIYAGLGYEFVSEDDLSLEDSAFLHTGVGVRYDIGKKFSLLSEVKALKRLSSSGDLDVVASLGLGMAFGGEATKQRVKRVVKPSFLPKVKQKPHYNTKPAIQEKAKPYYNTKPSYEQRTKPVYTKPIYGQQSAISDGTYYIQMGAFESNRNIKNSKYTNRINNMGLDTTVKQVFRNGHSVNLLLVGPYSSDREARADLSRAKRVVRGAFIKRIVN